MRILRLGLGDGRSVDLHPAVSVVTGLTDAQRTELRRGFTAIGTGLSPAPAGLVEAHGLLLDATQDDLDLLDIAPTARSTVATVADIPGAVPDDDDVARLRATERDLVLLASDGGESRRDLARVAGDRSRIRPALTERAAELRARIARHEGRDPEVLRVALDHVRDAVRAGATPDGSDLARALADVGLDTVDLGLADGELVRIAEDWLDERARASEWVVGAHVELQGIEGVTGAPGEPDVVSANPGADEVRRRASHAARTHADTVVRADELRSQLVARHAPRPAADELQAHILARLVDHRPERLAGAVPLLLDGILGHLDDHDVAPLLDGVAGAAGPVQLVVVDEHPAARAWAEAIGVHRAAVVTPDDGSPAST